MVYLYFSDCENEKNTIPKQNNAIPSFARIERLENKNTN